MIRCWFDGACNDNGNINAETGIGFAIDTGEDRNIVVKELIILLNTKH